MALITAQQVDNIDKDHVMIPATSADSYENHPGAILYVRNTSGSNSRTLTINTTNIELFDEQAGELPLGNIVQVLGPGDRWFFAIHPAHTDDDGIVSVGYSDETDLEVCVLHVKN